MKKNITPYLPYYIGQEIATEDEQYNSPGLKLIGISDMGCQVRDEGIGLTFYVSPDTCKLRLRPLESMTEDEAIDIFKMCSLFDLSECTFEFSENDETWINATLNGRVIDSIQFVGDNVEMTNNDGTFSAINPISPVINYYRKIGIDCDGLIDAGLAIDKTLTK